MTKSILLAATAMTVATTATPAMAEAEADDGAIIVTANRFEQDIQDVAASITVFDQEKLDNNNIMSAKDIATYTPGVYAQTRFGNDTTTYTIRGFAQEQRTTATVGTYFAEVVAPRGNGVSQGGDGASPGALFDLENVQVLKGPQGTLFGRNTTGGAVLLVPVKPRDEFEAYVEATVGNLNRWRIQGVLNLPISDTFRIRLGVDRQMRDGYIQNVGLAAQHDEDMGSIDILALRASAVWDISDRIENYTIFSWSESKGSGAIPLIKSNLAGGAFLGLVQAQQAVEQATGNWWAGTNANPLGESFNQEMRVINRTTIELSDSITLTNIFGYAEYKGNNAVDAFGFNSPIAIPATGPTSFFSFVPIYSNPDYGLTANQRSIVEELRLNGTSGRLTWQAGLYYEKNSPKDFTGTLTSSLNSCANIAQFVCGTGRPGGISANKVWNTSMAAYAQATYEFTEQLSVTAGLRYTEDKTRADWNIGRINFAAPQTFSCTFPHPTDSGILFANTAQNRLNQCRNQAATKTAAPTWKLSIEYKPNTDMLFYGSWVRGYRQGGLSPATGVLQLVSYGEETVDTFEIGGKTSWDGAVRGTFNFAAFYNDFRGQQIQVGFNNASRTIQSTIIDNAVKSYMYGVEADLMIEPAEWVRLEASYSYNKTKLKAVNPLNLNAIPGVAALGLTPRTLAVGGPIPLAVPHAFNASLTLKLPVPESTGDISLTGSIVHLSSFRAVADAVPGSGTGVLPKRTFGNANLTWKNIGGGPIDATFYVTNITNEKMFTHVNDQTRLGLVAYSVDEQRQFGLRVKYRFGALGN
ncbi:MAG: TonB-dependent receptor [Novosphingobium sp.]|nr:TonB-dependent receptor [Novosphingobium sp.]